MPSTTFFNLPPGKRERFRCLPEQIGETLMTVMEGLSEQPGPFITRHGL